MRYLALGDSISIDTYTRVRGGGAASQLARLLGATGDKFQDLTLDGNTASNVLRQLAAVRGRPDVATLTAGGNDFLHGRRPAAILADLDAIVAHVAGGGTQLVLNTVYDPTDGDDGLAERFGMPAAARRRFDELNDGIRAIAARRGALLCDLERLFAGHGIAAREPWIVLGIEPNLSGATAIARAWHDLLARDRPG